MKLTGNTVLITGGASGIGLSLVKKLYLLNNNIIVAGRNRPRLKYLKAQFPLIDIFPGDLSERVALNELVKLISQNHPTLNILVNNAGVQYNYNFINEPEIGNNIDYEIQTNLIAPIQLSAKLLPLIVKNTPGAVINLGSGLSISPKRSAPVYCATKAAIHSFSKTLRYQLENTGVKVFEIIPPLVDTHMTEGRGKAKISADRLVDDFLKNFVANKYESYIGKAKLLRLLHRLSPSLADKIMKEG